jgi:hypothetical protein
MSVGPARVPHIMKRRSFLAPRPGDILTQAGLEIARSFQAGLELVRLLLLWIALHIALGALAIAKVILLAVRSRSSQHD